MDEMLLKNRLSFWKILADKNEPIKNDLFVKFMIYWLIFDGYLSEQSGSDRDCNKLKWFCDNQNSLRKEFEECLKGSIAQIKINFFIKRGGVPNMSPGGIGKRKTITDPNNLKEIIDVIYQVRCNLFHGAKDRMSGDDQQVVDAALGLIEMPINLWLIH